MSTFDLDTSGSVDHVRLHGCVETGLEIDWSDLTPSAQGYVEAMFAALPEHGYIRANGMGFRHIAPATVERIIADCAAMVTAGCPNETVTGRLAWGYRQQGLCTPDFQPLTVHLSDDGLIMLREVGE